MDEQPHGPQGSRRNSSSTRQSFSTTKSRRRQRRPGSDHLLRSGRLNFRANRLRREQSLRRQRLSAALGQRFKTDSISLALSASLTLSLSICHWTWSLGFRSSRLSDVQCLSGGRMQTDGQVNGRMDTCLCAYRVQGNLRIL